VGVVVTITGAANAVTGSTQRLRDRVEQHDQRLAEVPPGGERQHEQARPPGSGRKKSTIVTRVATGSSGREAGGQPTGRKDLVLVPDGRAVRDLGPGDLPAAGGQVHEQAVQRHLVPSLSRYVIRQEAAIGTPWLSATLISTSRPPRPVAQRAAERAGEQRPGLLPLGRVHRGDLGRHEAGRRLARCRPA
jgi:hypothetical protein